MKRALTATRAPYYILGGKRGKVKFLAAFENEIVAREWYAANHEYPQWLVDHGLSADDPNNVWKFAASDMETFFRVPWSKLLDCLGNGCDDDIWIQFHLFSPPINLEIISRSAGQRILREFIFGREGMDDELRAIITKELGDS